MIRERIRNLNRIIFDRSYRFDSFALRGFYDHLSDEEFIKRKFRLRMGYDPDLDDPQTFNEKLQWLKLHDRKPVYTVMADKNAVKEYVAKMIGKEYIIPTLRVWEKAEDIDPGSLPGQFVLKCTHDSGGLIVVKDKSKLNISAVRKKIDRSLKRNYYSFGREWQYKNIPARVLAEAYKCDDTAVPLEKQELTDYKFYCFNGIADCVLVCSDRASGTPTFYFFDKEWNLKRYNQRGIEAPEGFTIPRPSCIDEMFFLAETLSKGIPFVRVDLYQSDRKVFFGEMTFYPMGGFNRNFLPETDLYFGRLLDLSFVKKDPVGDNT